MSQGEFSKKEGMLVKKMVDEIHNLLGAPQKNVVVGHMTDIHAFLDTAIERAEGEEKAPEKPKTDMPHVQGREQLEEGLTKE